MFNALKKKLKAVVFSKTERLMKKKTIAQSCKRTKKLLK